MATLRNTVSSTNATTALGGTVTGGDTVIFQEGAIDYLTGTDIDAYDLAGLTFTEGFRGTFKKSLSAQLSLVCSAGTVTNNSPASQIDLKSSSVAAGVLALIQNGTGDMTLEGMYATTLYAKAGRTTVANGANVTTAYVVGGILTLDEDGSYPATTLEVGTGVLYCNRDHTTLNVRGGLVRMQSDTITSTTLTMHGGNLDLRAASTIGTFNGYGGLLDLTQAERVPTFTTTVHWPSLTIKMRYGQTEPTWGSLTQVAGGARRVYV